MHLFKYGMCGEIATEDAGVLQELESPFLTDLVVPQLRARRKLECV